MREPRNGEFMRNSARFCIAAGFSAGARAFLGAFLSQIWFVIHFNVRTATESGGRVSAPLFSAIAEDEARAIVEPGRRLRVTG